jgi:hypothetical protein
MTVETDINGSGASEGLLLSYPHAINSTDSNNKPEYVHSVVFTINTRTNSPGFQSGKSGKAAGSVAKSDNKLPIEDGVLGNVLAAGSVGAAAGAVISGGLSSILGAVLGASAANFLLGEDGAAETIKKGGEKAEEILAEIAKYAGSINPVIKTDKIIRLYTPQSPQEEYSAGWTDVEFGVIGGLANSDKSIVEQIQGAVNGTDPAARERAVRVLTGLTNVTQAAGFNFRLQDAIELQTGKIPNPYKEQLFKGMNFRTFAYQFKFIPKNQAEFDSTYEIINTFRAHMHPERTDDFFIMYPSQFSIEYQYKGQKNKFLTKIADCALVNMKIDYGSGGALTTFQGTFGAPTEITMTLQFKELELITREHFDGYGKDAAGKNNQDPPPVVPQTITTTVVDGEAEEDATVQVEPAVLTPAEEAARKAAEIAKYKSDLEIVNEQIKEIKATYNGEVDGPILNDQIRRQQIINENLNRLGAGSSTLEYRESSAG